MYSSTVKYSTSGARKCVLKYSRVQYFRCSEICTVHVLKVHVKLNTSATQKYVLKVQSSTLCSEICILFFYSADPRSMKMFVLDEADEMLSRGFKDQIYDVFRKMPSNIQASYI